MNKSQILNCILLIALVALGVYTLLSHRSNDNASVPATPITAVADSTGFGDWHSIKPEEIKNPVTLFSSDWMALAAGKKGDLNAMTVGWGTLGVLWGKPVVTVYVRTNRYTHTYLDRNDHFTLTAFPEEKREALNYIGTHSGRDDKNKLQEAGLTPEFTPMGNPIFKEANLAIECKLLYKEDMKKELMPQDVVSDNYGKESNTHTVYVGEIVNVWKK